MNDDRSKEKEQLKISLEKLGSILDSGISDEFMRDSLYVKIHDIYSGIERMLRDILVHDHNIELRKESWHSDILEKTFDHGLISPEEFRYLRMVMAFRHRFRNGYAHQIETERMIPVAEFLRQFAAKFLEQF